MANLDKDKARELAGWVEKKIKKETTAIPFYTENPTSELFFLFNTVCYILKKTKWQNVF